ncbi:RNA polymerase II C-terminal domain phosphatase-like 3 [Musa acuminata AAA Group]|uniref:RNA polymerase II C-terminal domain phosphatase-like 3 n=2 Tax=Musa acuminata AAA Group TaxID=214697 RepID=UPI0031DA37BE
MNPMSTQAFMGTQAVPSVLHPDNLQQQEQLLLSLLTHIKDQYSTLITTEQTKQIDAIVDSFVSEGHKTEKEQYGGTRNHILTNLTQEPAISPGDYNEGSHSASTLEIVSVGGTTNSRKRKRVEEYVPLDHTTKKLTGSELSLNNSPFESNETGKTPQSASMSSQNDRRTIHLKPREPRHSLFRNVAAASEPNKVNRVIVGPHDTTGHGKQAPTVASTTAVPHGNIRLAPRKTRKVEDAKPTPTPAVASPESAKGDTNHPLDGRSLERKAAFQRERARRLVEQNRMFASRKLSLVLDLDHTLLNSTKFVDVDPMQEELLKRKEEQDRAKPQRHLFRLRHMGLWTKLRPGIWNFLEKANELYELHIYTLGSRPYATAMAKLLDPTGSLFGGRVMSGRDDGDRMVSQRKDLKGVLGLECAAVIMDDTPSVWPSSQPNLIAVERYHFFPSSRRKFGVPGPSLLEMDRDEREEDGTLASSLAIIQRIHDDFFSRHADGDFRKLLLRS